MVSEFFGLTRKTFTEDQIRILAEMVAARCKARLMGGE